jgi:hypothetical protein
LVFNFVERTEIFYKRFDRFCYFVQGLWEGLYFCARTPMYRVVRSDLVCNFVEQTGKFYKRFDRFCSFVQGHWGGLYFCAHTPTDRVVRSDLICNFVEQTEIFYKRFDRCAVTWWTGPYDLFTRGGGGTTLCTKGQIARSVNTGLLEKQSFPCTYTSILSEVRVMCSDLVCRQKHGVSHFMILFSFPEFLDDHGQVLQCLLR